LGRKPCEHRRRSWASRAFPPLIILGGIAFAFWWPLERPASTISGRAIIVDGDTIDVRGERIRILDIDAPESDQPCRRSDGNAVQCGQLASRALTQLIGAYQVTCDVFRHDRYGRWLGRCSVAEQDIARWLARMGLAVPYRDCACVVIRALSFYAQVQELGIWSTNFAMPWDWRAMN
jgi:endonuclease YncB( thermonuclease family)